MSVESTKSDNQIKRVYRVRKMTIVEEEEIITTEIQENPFESTHSQIDVHMTPISHIEIASPYIEEEQESEDFEERKELAKIIGLTEVPKKTVDAIDEIFGMFDSIITDSQVDVVKMIKDLRQRC